MSRLIISLEYEIPGNNLANGKVKEGGQSNGQGRGDLNSIHRKCYYHFMNSRRVRDIIWLMDLKLFMI